MNKKSEVNSENDKSVNTGDLPNVSTTLPIQLTPDKPKLQDLKTTDKISNQFYSLLIDPPILDLKEKDTFQYKGCKCSRSHCLKMYCVCFSYGKMCQSDCFCQSCHNKTDNLSRSEAIHEIITKDPYAFSKSRAGQVENLGGGCNCKRSNCSKKYCQCLRKGLKCGRNCKCSDCQNIKSEQNGQPRKRVKLQSL